MNVPATIATMKNRYSVLNDKTLDIKDVVQELLIHIMQLEEICLQQQRDIDDLKNGNYLA